MKVLHSSDIHGKYKRLIEGHASTDFDVWLDTGDFFENLGRKAKTGHLIVAEEERRYQIRWLRWKDLAVRLRKWLAGRPVLLMPGNHDFIELAMALERANTPNVHRISPQGAHVLGRTWAGFREIPHMSGEWVGETRDFGPQIASTFAADPDVLVTHAPPKTVLDDEVGYGVEPLTERLDAGGHRIRHHFFGHCHADGGRQVSRNGIRFYNGACHTMVHDLSA